MKSYVTLSSFALDESSILYVGDIVDLVVDNGVSSTFLRSKKVDAYFDSKLLKNIDIFSCLSDTKDKINAWWNYMEHKLRKIYEYVS